MRKRGTNPIAQIPEIRRRHLRVRCRTRREGEGNRALGGSDSSLRIRPLIRVSACISPCGARRFHHETPVFDAGQRGFLRVVVIMVSKGLSRISARMPARATVAAPGVPCICGVLKDLADCARALHVSMVFLKDLRCIHPVFLGIPRCTEYPWFSGGIRRSKSPNGAPPLAFSYF